MPRSKRTVIDDAVELGFANYGTSWYDRGTYQAYTAEPVAPEDDWITLSVPTIYRPDGTSTNIITIWGRGLVTFGAPTEELQAYMKTLSAGTDLHAFLAGLPGDYIDGGFQSESYGDIEFGQGVKDFIKNPFGVFHDPNDPSPTGPVLFDWGQVRDYAYVGWGSEPYEGAAEDWDWYESVPFGPDARDGVEFSEEGFRLGPINGAVRLGGVTVSPSADGFFYYSEFNVVTLGDSADTGTVTGGPEALLGMSGDDHLTGGGGADRLDGGDDNDVLVGGGGIDRLFGGDGNDDLTDGDEQGMLSGGAGDDVLHPGGGEDTIDGGDGIDRVVVDYSGWGGAIGFTLDPGKSDYLFPDAYKRMTGVEAMTFTSGGGDDQLTGASGDDVLSGGGGQDALRGGDGDDVLSGGDEHDYLEGGTGDDRLDGGTGYGPVVITDDGYFQQAYDLDANPYLQVRTMEQPWNGAAYWSSDFYFTATSATQSLTVDYSPLDGDSSYYSVSIYYVVGNDWYDVYGGGNSGGQEVYNFGSFSYYDADGNLMDFQPGRYVLSLYATDDDAAPITITAHLSGVPYPDGDTMIGGVGDDTYVVDSLYDRVLENANEGRDAVVTSLAGYSLESLPDIERLLGDAGAQTLTGNAGDNAIVSGGGADTLDGAGGDDLLVIATTPAHVEGGTGVDTLAIRQGVTVTIDPGLVSGVEKVLVRAGATLDLSMLEEALAPIRAKSGDATGATIIGTGGADRIHGGAGPDTLRGGAGDDLIVLTRQAVVVEGGEGSDTLKLGGAPGGSYAFAGASLAGIERVLLGAGTALDLTGLVDAPGRIRLVGGAQVTGSESADRIYGSADADVIAGGGGADRMTGGGGADRFVFLSPDDAPHSASARDLIEDFNGLDGDRLDLSSLSDGGFAFLGTAAFHGAAATSAEVRLVIHGDRSTVQVDIDHDAHADLSFVVHTAAPLTATDFDF